MPLSQFHVFFFFFNPLSPVRAAHMYPGLGIPTGSWVTIETAPWRKLIFPPPAASSSPWGCGPVSLFLIPARMLLAWSYAALVEAAALATCFYFGLLSVPLVYLLIVVHFNEPSIISAKLLISQECRRDGLTHFSPSWALEFIKF